MYEPSYSHSNRVDRSIYRVLSLSNLKDPNLINEYENMYDREYSHSVSSDFSMTTHMLLTNKYVKLKPDRFEEEIKKNENKNKNKTQNLNKNKSKTVGLSVPQSSTSRSTTPEPSPEPYQQQL